MSDGKLKDEETIRDQVLARIRIEEAEAAEQGDGPSGFQLPVPTHDFVDQCLEANELGDGMLFAFLYRDRHAFVGQYKEWIYWTGHHWRIDEVDKAHRARADVEGVAEAYQRTLDHYRVLAREERDSGNKESANRLDRKVEALRKRVSKLRSESGRQRCLDFAMTNREVPLAIGGSEIDRDPWALPFANGLVDLRTGKHHPGRPQDFLMKASPVEWQGVDAKCPEWEKFMLEIMGGDAEMVSFLQRVFGYGITGLAREHVFIVLYGRGRNGKGIMTELIQEVLGGSDSFCALAGPVQSEMLLDQGKNRNAAGPSPDIMTLRGLRMAFASETDEGQRFSPARVKWLSGGETLTGRYPHDKRNIPFTPTHLLCLLTNHKPHAPATDFAFWERLLLVEFPLSFVDRKPQTPDERPMDKGLKDRLMAELPGIAAWLVRGCLDWQERKSLDPPPKVRDATADYRKEEDLLGDFLEDCCEIILEEPEKTRTVATELYDSFMWWYRQNISAKRDFSQKAFGKLMLLRFQRERKGGSYYYYGVRVRQEVLDRSKGQEDIF